MAQIQSQNENSLTQIRQFVTPNILEVVIYALIAGLLLVLFNARDIWDSVQASLALTDNPSPAAGGSSSGVWDKIANSPLPQLVFWAAIGAAVYAAVWFVWNIVNNLRNDMAADKFVHPRQYKKSNYWGSVMARKALFVLCAVVLAVYLVMFFNLLAVISDLAYSAAQQLSLPAGVVELALYVLLATALVYVLVLISRLSARTWGTIYKDL